MEQVDWGDCHMDTAAAEVAAATEATVTPQAAVAAGDGPMNSNEHPTERGTTSVADGEETPPALHFRGLGSAILNEPDDDLDDEWADTATAAGPKNSKPASASIPVTRVDRTSTPRPTGRGKVIKTGK